MYSTLIEMIIIIIIMIIIIIIIIISLFNPSPSAMIQCMLSCSSVGGAAVIKHDGRRLNSHPGQSFSLSLCELNNSISRANVWVEN